VPQIPRLLHERLTAAPSSAALHESIERLSAAQARQQRSLYLLGAAVAALVLLEIWWLFG
jgi:hypothetical protein